MLYRLLEPRPGLVPIFCCGLLLAACHGSRKTPSQDLPLPQPAAADEGAVAAFCDPEAVLCGRTADDCVDLSVSVRHCGACGHRCFNNQSCDEGRCTGVGVLTPQQLHEALRNKDFELINVRVPPVGIIPGTDASIPHNQVEQLLEAIGEDRDRRVVLYCGTTTRIKVTLQLLRDHGYRNVSVLENGVRAWDRAGYEVLDSKL